jgi:hypothetical protein
VQFDSALRDHVVYEQESSTQSRATQDDDDIRGFGLESGKAAKNFLFLCFELVFDHIPTQRSIASLAPCHVMRYLFMEFLPFEALFYGRSMRVELSTGIWRRRLDQNILCVERSEMSHGPM